MADDLVFSAEQIVLGSMMLDPSVIEPVTKRLCSSDFADVGHRSVFAAIVANRAADADTGAAAVAIALNNVKELRRVGGANYLHDLIACVPTVANVGYYTGIVANAALARATVADAARLSQVAESGDVEKIRAEQSRLTEAWSTAPVADASSWAPIDLERYLDGSVEPAMPTVGIVRSDGLRLIYPGKEHAVIGEMESGKSWFCCACVAAELEAGNYVVYVHYEECDPTDTIGRLLALGVSRAAIRERLLFVGPQEPVTTTAIAGLIHPPPSLAVHDGVNEAMSLHGWGIRDEDGAASFRRRLVMPFTHVGSATLAADHVVKDREARGRNAIGSVHKGNGLSGTLVMLETTDPFGRGKRGRSHVYITKDRPGQLRQHGRGDPRMPGKTYMGELVVDDTQMRTPDLELRFWAPTNKSTQVDDTDPRETARREAKQGADEHVLGVIDALVAEGHTASFNAVVARSDFGKSKTTESLERLLLDGILTDRREGQHRVFYRSGQPVYRSGWSGCKHPDTSETGLAGLGRPTDHSDHSDHFEVAS